MTTEPIDNPAPAEFSFQVTIRRGQPEAGGAFSLITGPLQTSDEAHAQIDKLRDAALADGLNEIAAALPKTLPGAPASSATGDLSGAAAAGDPGAAPGNAP